MSIQTADLQKTASPSEAPSAADPAARDEAVRASVQARYARIALRADTSRESCCDDECGCGNYAAEDLAGLSQSVTEVSLGCGRPVDGAALAPGETVLDLGSGGGIDCLLAAGKVGPRGRVIGVDMTPEMVARARAAAAEAGAENVDFREGRIEAIPVEDASVDVILSNCVINLAPDKAPVFREMARVLRPGGRLRISDIVQRGGAVPEADKGLGEDWAACVAGALPDDAWRAGLAEAGFEAIEIDPEPGTAPDGATLAEGQRYSARILARRRA